MSPLISSSMGRGWGQSFLHWSVFCRNWHPQHKRIKKKSPFTFSHLPSHNFPSTTKGDNLIFKEPFILVSKELSEVVSPWIFGRSLRLPPSAGLSNLERSPEKFLILYVISYASREARQVCSSSFKTQSNSQIDESKEILWHSFAVASFYLNNLLATLTYFACYS
jgi:hypothetical protein